MNRTKISYYNLPSSVVHCRIGFDWRISDNVPLNRVKSLGCDHYVDSATLPECHLLAIRALWLGIVQLEFVSISEFWSGYKISFSFFTYTLIFPFNPCGCMLRWITISYCQSKFLMLIFTQSRFFVKILWVFFCQNQK